jgi:hypothetical protein
MSHLIRSSTGKTALVTDDYYYAWQDMLQYQKDNFVQDLWNNDSRQAAADFNIYLQDHFKGSVAALRSKWGPSDIHRGAIPLRPSKPGGGGGGGGGGSDVWFWVTVATGSAIGLYLLLALLYYVRS